MADAKISALTALTGANVDAAADVLAIVDTSVTTTKKILVSELSQAMLVLGTEQATTSGTAIDFNSIPSWVKEITLILSIVQTNGTSAMIVQIGDSGGIESTNYVSMAGSFSNAGNAVAGSTGGFIINGNSHAASDVYTGKVIISLENAANFRWISEHRIAQTDANVVHFGAGGKATSAALDRIRLTTAGGVDTFTAGVANILYR